MYAGSAHLMVGPQQKTTQAIIQRVQKLLCPKNHPCGSCIVCTSIKEKNYHSLLWITPEQRYTLDDIEPIFERSKFVLNEHQKMIFILEHADYLTAATANALLKIVEEPPTGYYFFFTAQRESQVLPTIRSRCHIHIVADTQQTELSPFEQFFMVASPCAQGFYSYLNTNCPAELETPSLVDKLLKAWIKRHKQALQQGSEQEQALCIHMIAVLQRALNQPPMPGSAKTFWKNLFLQREFIA